MARASGVRIGAIENSGPNTLVSYLRSVGRTASQIDIAVAFITTAGLDSVLHLLKRVSARGQVRLLTGLYQGFTEPKSLRILLREQQQLQGRLTVHISSDARFHWKAYFVRGNASSHIMIGSSNLTDDGLRQTGEFNAVLTMQKGAKQFSELHKIFEKHWKAKSSLLTNEVLDKYEDWRASVEIASHGHKVPLSRILTLSGREPKAQPERKACFWRTAIDGDLSDEAEAMLMETTDWDRRGYLYLSTWRASFSVGDRLVLFDLGERNVTLVEIKETTRTPKRTPDGFHFAAYRRLRRTRLRRLTPKRWKSLKEAGLIPRRSDVHMTRRLSAEAFQRFVESLKSTVK